jgi:hypothetical protein
VQPLWYSLDNQKLSLKNFITSEITKVEFGGCSGLPHVVGPKIYFFWMKPQVTDTKLEKDSYCVDK